MPLDEANLVNHVPAILSRMPLAEVNLVNHFPTILSRMPLAEANLAIRFLAILLRVPLAEANLVNTLDFIYIEHDIIVIAFTRKTLNCISAKRRENHTPALLIS